MANYGRRLPIATLTNALEFSPLPEFWTVVEEHTGPDDVADVLARACGHWGSGADYLRNTVAHLEEQSIRDRNLWRLQALVAERIRLQARSNMVTSP